MPTKRLPIVGQDIGNWGQILNDHLAQLNNPITGGMNTSTVASRPTNLTANDAGYTTLNTDTGNLHKWSGTDWSVLNQSVINAKDFGGFTADAIQKAIDSTDSYSTYMKSNVIVLDVGEWYIEKPIKLKSGIQIVGRGRATFLIPDPTLGDNYMFYTPENSGSFDEIHFENFSIQDNQTSVSRTKYHFNLCNTVNLRISKIRFSMEGRTLSDVGGINVYTDYTATSFLPRIVDCIIGDGSIVMGSTDSWIMRNSIFGHNRSFAIQMKTASAQIEHNEMLGSPIHGCVYIDAGVGTNLTGILIRNNYFDGGYADTNGGSGIKCVSNLGQSIISSNWFYNNSDEGIILTNPTDLVINGNVFDSSNRRDAGKHEIIINGDRGPQNTIITSNTFSRIRNPQTNKGYVIVANGPYTDAKQNIISNNVVNTANYLVGGIQISDNIAFTVLQNKGMASIIPEFNDNTSAILGGLVAGDTYRTGDILKIVH